MLATIIPALEQRDWFAALNLKDAYFHITISPMHNKFLWFVLGQDHFQYTVLSFGLSTAPCVFSKVLTVAAAHLRKHWVMIYHYLDDHLIKAHTWAEAIAVTHQTTSLFTSLSIQTNVQNSTLTPVQKLDLIGAHLNSLEVTASLPLQRFATLTNHISTSVHSPRISAGTCLQLLDHMVVTMYMVKHARLYMHCLQCWLKMVFTPHTCNLNQLLSMPTKVKDSLQW